MKYSVLKKTTMGYLQIGKLRETASRMVVARDRVGRGGWGVAVQWVHSFSYKK